MVTDLHHSILSDPRAHHEEVEVLHAPKIVFNSV